MPGVAPSTASLRVDVELELSPRTRGLPSDPRVGDDAVTLGACYLFVGACYPLGMGATIKALCGRCWSLWVHVTFL